MYRKGLDSNEVLQRIRKGDCPRVTSTMSLASTFDDGSGAAHQVMARVQDALGLTAAPKLGERWQCPAVTMAA